METIRQLSLFLENKPGHVYQICQTLADAGVNIYSVSLADTNQFGILRLIVEDAGAASELLSKKGFVVNLADVLAVKIDNQPGGLAFVSKLLSEQEINMEYVYPFADRHIIIFRVSDNEKAYSTLVSNGFSVLSHDEVFNTNK